MCKVHVTYYIYPYIYAYHNLWLLTPCEQQNMILNQAQQK